MKFFLMAKNIEVEIRGPLTEDEYNKLADTLKNNGQKKQVRSRLSIMYFRNKIPKNAEEIKDDPVDLRIRITNKKAEIVMKYGLWGGKDKREEYIFPIELKKVGEAVEFLKRLGWKHAVIYATRSIVYEYNGIEFSLVEIEDYGYYYEAEVLASYGEETVAEEKILQTCEFLKIRQYAPGEFEKQCDHINNKKELQVNFEHTSFTTVKERFKELF